MKKIIVFACAALLFGCNDNEVVQPTIERDEILFVGMPDNARTSLDYTGTYIGYIPVEGGSEMMVTLTIGESTYVRSISYLEPESEDIFTNEGTYSWNAAGNTITLDGILEEPNDYFVAENKLIQLDINGKKVTGELAKNYELIKQNP